MNTVLMTVGCRQLQRSQHLSQFLWTTPSQRYLSGAHNGQKLSNSTKFFYNQPHKCTYLRQLTFSIRRFTTSFFSSWTKTLIDQRTLFLVPCRHLSQRSSQTGSSKDRATMLLYLGALGIFMLGMGYAGVPLYRMFCQATGLGGSGWVVPGHDSSKVAVMKPVTERKITVKFNADTTSSMQWKFRPQQPRVELVPGETALAFYTAHNPTDKPVIGISTYSVVPFEAGLYFNKIQCFCFEEQRLNPHEQVDMPVFFFIDPEFAEDPKLENVEEITLSYTFFEAKEGMKLPLPGYMQPIQQPQ